MGPCCFVELLTTIQLLAEKELTLKWAIDIAVAAEMGFYNQTMALYIPELDLCAVCQTCHYFGRQGHNETACQFHTHNCF